MSGSASTSPSKTRLDDDRAEDPQPRAAVLLLNQHGTQELTGTHRQQVVRGVADHHQSGRLRLPDLR